MDTRTTMDVTQVIRAIRVLRPQDQHRILRLLVQSDTRIAEHRSVIDWIYTYGHLIDIETGEFQHDKHFYPLA
jgi:hypothetical protein